MKSVQTKIITFILVSAIIVSIIIAAISFTTISEVLHKNAEENMNLTCLANIEKIELVFGNVRESLDTMVLHINENLISYKQLNNQEYLNEFINEIEKVSLSHVHGTEVTQSIYLLFNTSVVYENKGFIFNKSDVTGKYEKSEGISIDEFNKKFAFDITEWELPGKERTPEWTDVYHSDIADKPVVSYIAPLYNNDIFYGIIGMDIPDDALISCVNDIVVYKSGFGVILNKDGSMFYHPQFKRNHVIKEVTDAIFNAENTYKKLISYKIDGEKRKMAVSLLSNGMRLAIVAPEREIYESQNTLIKTVVHLLFVSLMGVFILAWIFTRRLTKPIKELNEAASQMSAGNLEVVIEPSTKDEIGALAVSFKEAQQKLKARIDDLYLEAHHDGLTGTGNIHAFRDLEEKINESIALNLYCQFGVAVFDVNRLKITNDILGHAAGDELLRVVATHLIAVFGRNNVFRIGGDEFVAIIRDADYLKRNYLILQCEKQMHDLRIPEYPDVSVSCAFGFAIFEHETDKCFADVLKRSDSQMYKNKAENSKKTEEWQKTSKSLKEIQLSKYIEFMRTLNQSTEDFLFLIECETEKSWLFGDINKEFNFSDNDEEGGTLDRLTNVTHPLDRHTLQEELSNLISGVCSEYNYNYRWINRLGEIVWVNCRGRCIKDDNDIPFVVIGRISYSAIQHLYHPVTGLYNKNKLTSDIKNGTLPEYNSLLLLEIDNLSDIYLKHGREYGNELVENLARVLEDKFKVEYIYHKEQDRFAVLLNVSNEENASVKEIEDIYYDIQNSIDKRYTVSAASVPNDKEIYNDENDIYEYAKQLLNDLESDNQLAFFSLEELSEKMYSVDLLEELERSVRNNFEGFFLCYQPRVETEKYSLVSMEALLRYKSEKRGMVFPNEFIPILEQTGLINKVGVWIIETALSQCKKWREKLPELHVSVNISAVQLKNESIADKIIELLDLYDMPGEALTVEITESAQLEDDELVSKIFGRLKDLGVKISIDDFGTGYSNLGYLRKIYADELKIDREFIKDIKETTYNYRVVKNIVEFAKTNSFQVCLEGVEKVEELAVIESLEPDILQGYLFGKPCTPDVFESVYIDKTSELYTENQLFVTELHKNKDNVHIINFEPKEILSEVNIGLWIIRVNLKNDKRELFADSVMRKLIGADEKATPEECYNLWHDKIKDEDEYIIKKMFEDLLSSDKVSQAEYKWNDSQRGELIVRSTGKCSSVIDDYAVFEGFHRIISDMGNTYS